MSIFAQTGVSTELLMMLISVSMLIMMNVTKPQNTFMLKLCKIGFIMSIVTIVANIGLIEMTMYYEHWQPFLFTIDYIVFVIAYDFLLCILFAYIDFLSYFRRAHKNNVILMAVISGIMYLAWMLYPVFTNQLVIVNNGSVVLTSWYYSYVCCGLVDALVCIVVMLSNRKTVSRIVWWGTICVIPFEIIILVAQFFFHDAVFTSITYVLPFCIFYILFHGHCFDEVIGSQYTDALDCLLENVIQNKKEFVLLSIRFPAIQRKEVNYSLDVIQYAASVFCRQLDKCGVKFRYYRYSNSNYCIFAEVSDHYQAEHVVENVANTLEKPLYYGKFKMENRYKMLVFYNSDAIDSVDTVKAIWNYEEKKFSQDMENEIIKVTPLELDEFKEHNALEEQLIDIRNTFNLDDSRVLCFAQPIYSIKNSGFRTAEALIRLKIGDEIIYPGRFIPIAEENGCIQVLTLIILNKVCKFINTYKDFYDFDAITINVSTLEMNNRNFHNEIINIIAKNEIDPKKIRIEITESLDTNGYEDVLYNMKKLNEYGIEFYLDDYGTGYSNLERIISCPFHTIKFDKSILYKGMSDEKADIVLKTSVKLFKESGFETVMEGVESEQQSEYVKNKGFDFIQGYLYSKPISIADLGKYFTGIQN